MSNRRLYILTAALAFPLFAEDSDGARMRALLDAQVFAASLDQAAVIARETAAAGHTGDLTAAQAMEWSAEARILNGDVSPEIGAALTRANEIIRRAANGETLDLARNLTLEGKYAFADGKYAEAVRELEQAATIRARLDAPPLDRVRTALALADAYRSLDRYPEAIALARETLARSEAAAGPESLCASLAHYSLGMALIRTEFSNAGSELEIARRLAETLTGPESAFTGQVVVALGTVAVHQARYPDGNRLFEEALAIFAKSVPAGHPRYLALWNNYALALKQSGNYEGAQRAFDSALTIATARLGPEHTITAQIYGNLGIVYSERGNYPEALRTYERVLAIQEKTLGPDHYPVAGILNSMGQLHAALTDFAQADREFTRAISIYEKTLGPTNKRTLSVRRSRIGLLLDSGKSEQARALAVETLELNRHAAEPDAVEIAAVENTLGKALMRLHRYKEARVYLEEAVAGLTGRPAALQIVASAYSNLGDLDADEGRFAEAVEWQHRAQSAYAAVPNGPYLANFRLREAYALAGAGKPADALEQALDAERRRQESVRIIAQGMAERLALLSTVQAEGGLALAMDCMRTDADTRRVWDLEIRGRNMILDELAARSHSWRQRDDSSTVGLWERLTDARTRLAGLAMREASGAGSQKEIAAARAETERLEEALAATDARFRFEQKRARAGLDDVLARLEPNIALVSFVAGTEYRAFVASASGAVRSFNLGSAASIDRLVSRWRAEIDRERDSFGRNAVRNEASYREAALTLRQTVWDPLLPALAGARIVFLVPDGRLDGINFAALPTAVRSYLAETGPLLHVLNAERDLLREASASPPRTKALLAVGEPAFGTVPGAPPAAVTFNAGKTSTCANAAGMTFAPLASSGEEIGEAVRFARGQGWQTELLRGTAATEEAVKSAAHGQQVVHIATHGFFLPENCGRSETVRESPLLRAGLVFAGANTRRRDAPAGPEDDGILTAEEAASLDLDGTEWVVLSGCETGVGETRAGEGALGLRRAFEEAGARTQIASLWPVRDADAAGWTESLYEARFVRHQSTVQAVAYAGRAAIARRRKAGLSTHPFYWAGFVASGDWR